MGFRWDCANLLLTETRQALAGQKVQVEPGWPGDTIRDEAIYLNEIVTGLDGQLDIADVTGEDEPEQIDDVFLIPVEFQVVAATLDKAMGRLDDLMEVVLTIVKNRASVESLPDLDWWQARSARATCAQLPTGRKAFGEVVIEVHSRSTT